MLASQLSAYDIIAHRGASYDAPENTLTSNRLAWEQQADLIETDIQLTADGKIIVSHDKILKRTTGKDIAIVKHTFDELRKLDVGSWKDPKYAGEKLPTLEEQLALIPAGKRFLIEIKVGPEIVPELVRCVARTKMSPKTVSFLSFNYETLKAVRKALPQFRTLLIAGYKAPKPGKEAKTLDDLVEMARAEGMVGLCLENTWPMTAEKMASIKAAGIEVHSWVFNDVEKAREWIAMGVMSITTDRPGWLREQLAAAKPAANAR